MQTNPSLEDTSVTPTSSTGTNKRPRPPSSTSASVAPKRTKKSASGEVDSEEETDNLLQSLQRPTPQSYPEVVPAPEPSAETPTTQAVESDQKDTSSPAPRIITPNPFEALANLEEEEYSGDNNDGDNYENEEDNSSDLDTVLEDALRTALTRPATPQQFTSLGQDSQNSPEAQDSQNSQKAQEVQESPVPQPLWPIEQTLDTIDQLCSPDNQR